MKTTYEIPPSFGAITQRDQLEAYSSDPLHVAMPDAVVRPDSAEQISQVLAYCNEHLIPVTPCGNQTSLTAGAITDRGVLLSSERLSRKWRIHEDAARPGKWLAYVGAAANLAEFQDALAAQGFFYPPDPTSRGEVMVGATVATNASGEDSYKYGSTRRWVRGMTYVRPDGEIRTVTRLPNDVGDASKNTCGYPFRASEVDLLVGSEGTLGVLTEVVVEILPYVPEFISILVFLENELDALKTVQWMTAAGGSELRCCEYLDPAAVGILIERAEGFECPDNGKAALYLKLEYAGDSDHILETWFSHIESFLGKLKTPYLIDGVQVFSDGPGQRKLREWRHLIPATINEQAARYRDHGGGKVGTDWYVPVAQLIDMFDAVRADQGDSQWVVFGHIGNGHPHFNFLARDLREYERDRKLLAKHCAMAVERGGGVSAEHGLGKKKAHLLTTQYSADEIAEMWAIKQDFDPNNILARGNIFPAKLMK